jgi:pimeloyl-ACP methyl ester carboxylesterase
MAFARSAARCAQQLHTTWIGSPASNPVVFRHGLLGNGKNVQTMARKHCERQGRSGLLMDVRGHGKSAVAATAGSNEHSIKTCAADVSFTLEKHADAKIDSVTLVGHSLGGRLSLQYAYDSLTPLPDRIWLLDTVPGAVFNSVRFVLEIAESFLEDDPVSTKKKAETILKREYFVDPSTAQWLSSSYQPENHQFEFDLKVANDLLKNFSEQDFLHQLDSVLQRGDMRVDLVRAGLNKGWDDKDIHYLQAKQSDNFGFHTIENAGHWVHIDALPALLDVMDR